MALAAPSSTLTGQTIADSYDQVLFLDSAAGVTEATLKIVSGTAGKTALSISDEHVLVKGVDTNNAAGFEVQQTDGTSILKVAAGTPSATLIGPLTVGANDLGHDVIFHGNTDSSNMTWDTSEDDLVLNDATLSIVQDDAQYGISVDQNTNQKAIYIDHDGVTSEATMYFASPTTTTGTVIRVDDCNALTTGRMMELKSAATNDGTRSLVQITNDAAAATGATCLSIQQDSTGKAISATGGIVEEGGALKENLLTNSGFDVWSNSTLVNCDSTGGVTGAGTNLISSGGWVNGDNTGAVAYDTLSESGTNLTSVISDGSDVAYAKTNYLNMELGKLYKATIVYTLNSGQNVEWGIGGTSDGGLYHAFKQLSGSGTYTKVVECTSTAMAGTDANSARLWIKNGEATNWVGNFTVTEVTPGCIATSTLSHDGWIKGTSSADLDIWRQHNDGGTYTHDGSFYGLKMTYDRASQVLYGGVVQGGNTDEYTQRFAGRTVTMGCWVKSVVAAKGGVGIDDATGGSGNIGAGGTEVLTVQANTWEWLEITKTMSSSAAGAWFYLRVVGHAGSVSGDHTVYFSQPMLVFGSSIGEGNYTRPQGEVVYFEADKDSTTYDEGNAISSNAEINLEAESNGVIPKGAKAINCTLLGESSTVEGYLSLNGADSSAVGSMSIYSQIADKKVTGNFWVPCNSNGDIWIRRNQTFNDVLVRVHAVELR